MMHKLVKVLLCCFMLTGHTYSMDTSRQVAFIVIDEAEEKMQQQSQNAAVRSDDTITTAYSTKYFDKEIAEFLFDMGYFKKATDPNFCFAWEVNGHSNFAVTALFDHFKISELWRTDKQNAELLILDIFLFVNERSQNISHIWDTAFDRFDEIVVSLFEAHFQKRGLFHSEKVLVFYKKLEHFLYNLPSKMKNLDYSRRVIPLFLADDNPDDYWDRQMHLEKLPGFEKTGEDSISFVIARFIKQQLERHSELFYQAFFRAGGLELNAITHAFMSVLAQDYKLQSTQKLSLSELAHIMPFHSYPLLLKNYKNAFCVVTLLNEVVKRKMSDGSRHELEKSAENSPAAKAGTGKHYTVFDDCLNTIINVIEHIPLESLHLDPWFEDLLLKKLKEKYPILFALKATRLNEMPWILLAEHLLNKKEYRKALYAFKRAEEFWATKDHAYLRLGEIYLHAWGVPFEANRALRYLLFAKRSKIESVSMQALLRLGEICVRQHLITPTEVIEQLVELPGFTLNEQGARYFMRVANQKATNWQKAVACLNIAILVLHKSYHVGISEDLAHQYLNYACIQDDSLEVRLAARQLRNQLNERTV